MLEYTFTIKHEGCWTETLNDRFPDVTATIIYSYRLTGTSITMIELTRVDEETIDELVDWLDDHEVMTTGRLVSYDDKRHKAFVSLEGDYDTDTEPVLNVLLRNNAFPTIPATVTRGREHWSVLVPNHGQVSQAHEELQELGSVDVDALRQPDLDRMLTGLTEVKKPSRTSRRVSSKCSRGPSRRGTTTRPGPVTSRKPPNSTPRTPPPSVSTSAGPRRRF